MPSLSSLFHSGHSGPNQPPSLIFHPPDATQIIRATTPQGQDAALFTISNKTLTRIHPNRQQVCTFHSSALSGSTRLTFSNGQQIKLKEVMESYQSGNRIDMDSPVGTLKWRPGSSGSSVELRDRGKMLLAKGEIHGTCHLRPSPLMVFVPGDEFLYDLILASWIALYKGHRGDSSAEELQIAGDIISAVAGN